MWGFPQSWGYPEWMVEREENPIYKWMRTGGIPIYGNPHVGIIEKSFH